MSSTFQHIVVTNSRIHDGSIPPPPLSTKLLSTKLLPTLILLLPTSAFEKDAAIKHIVSTTSTKTEYIQEADYQYYARII